MKEHGIIEDEIAEGLAESLIKSTGMHYENVLQEIKSEIAEYFLCEQQPPSALFKTEKQAEKLIAEINSKIEG
tara:strand:- start:1432 stop:1650 length:219 start_codon:yes stop_codon:yes gene_type:complete